MSFKVFFLLAIICSSALAGLFSTSTEEYIEKRCNSACPNEAAVASCCRENGFITGFCTFFGNADCKGRRFRRSYLDIDEDRK